MPKAIGRVGFHGDIDGAPGKPPYQCVCAQKRFNMNAAEDRNDWLKRWVALVKQLERLCCFSKLMLFIWSTKKTIHKSFPMYIIKITAVQLGGASQFN